MRVTSARLSASSSASSSISLPWSCGFAPTPALVTEAVNVVAAANPFHAVRTYFEGLTWDGERRLDLWLSTYLGTEQSEYTSAVGAMWVISAVARIMLG